MYNIVRVPILPFHMVNAHLIMGDKGCVLVDCGLPGSETRVASLLARHNRTLRDIRLIVVTHAHVDHAGGAQALRNLTGAPILAHQGDLPYYRREIPMQYCPSGWAGSVFLKTSLPHEGYAAFEPDILLQDGQEFDLQAVGFAGKVLPTPGHTTGSVSVVMDTQEALVGDMVASGMLIGGLFRRGHAIRPPFEDDPQRVGWELKKLLNQGCRKFHLGHGGPLNAGEVTRHAERLIKSAC